MDELPEKLYTLGEAAALLRVDTRTLGRWCNEGLVSHIRLPTGHKRIPESALRAMFKEAKTDG